MVEMHKGRKVVFKDPTLFGNVKRLRGGTVLWSSPDGELANEESLRAAENSEVFTIERIGRDGWVYLDGLDMPVRKCFLIPLVKNTTDTRCRCASKNKKGNKSACSCKKAEKKLSERSVDMANYNLPEMLSAASTVACLSSVLLKSVDASMDRALAKDFDSKVYDNAKDGFERIVRNYADRVFDVIRAVNNLLFGKDKEVEAMMNQQADKLLSDSLSEFDVDQVKMAIDASDAQGKTAKKKSSSKADGFKMTPDKEKLIVGALDALVEELGIGDGTAVTVKIGKLK